MKPLEDVKILDFSRLLPGPLCTMHLADLGAEVFKIEDTKQGDYTRNLPPFKKTISTLYLLLNKNKKSLSIDYYNPEGKEIICEMVSKVDILLESFRPGIMKNIGLDYETLSKINPKLIYCSITGYGQTGPMANQAGHDLNYIGYNGILEQIGKANQAPAIPNFQLADIVGGSMTAAMSILAAYISAQKTNKGAYIDVSMMEGSMVNSFLIMNALESFGQTFGRGNDILTGSMPFYEVYETQDNKFMALAAVEVKFWIKFCEAVNKPDWIDKHMIFGNDAIEFKSELATFFSTKTQSEWIEVMVKHDCCVTPIYNLEDALELEHIKNRKLISTFEHPTEGQIKHFRYPALISDYEYETLNFAPNLGQNSLEILKEFGIENYKIDELKSNNLIKY